jgi:hypothetical protein
VREEEHRDTEHTETHREVHQAAEYADHADQRGSLIRARGEDIEEGAA